MVFSRKPTGCARYSWFMPRDAPNRDHLLSLAAATGTHTLTGTTQNP